MRTYQMIADREVTIDGTRYAGGDVIATVQCDCPGSIGSLLRSGYGKMVAADAPPAQKNAVKGRRAAPAAPAAPANETTTRGPKPPGKPDKK